jgi:hypothetical protein
VLFVTLAPESRCPSKQDLTYEIKKAKSSLFKRFLKKGNVNVGMSGFFVGSPMTNLPFPKKQVPFFFLVSSRHFFVSEPISPCVATNGFLRELVHIENYRWLGFQ